MTDYRVHIYRPYRTVFTVSANSQEAALQAALALPVSAAIEVEDAEGIPTGFLVDTLLPDGQVDYDVDWTGDLDPEGKPVEDGLDA